MKLICSECGQKGKQYHREGGSCNTIKSFRDEFMPFSREYLCEGIMIDVESTCIPTKNYSKKGFALKYPDGKLAAVDMSSDGYTYRTDSISEVWMTTKEKLEKYLRAGNGENLKIVALEIIAVVSEWEV